MNEINKQDPAVGIGPRLPTQELTNFNEMVANPIEPGASLALMNENRRLRTLLAAREVLAISELVPEKLPEPLVCALAKLHESLAGPGPSGLDERPQSLEEVNDPVLHARALVEAQARMVKQDRAIQAEIAALPAEVQADAQLYNESKLNQREEIFQAYSEGKQAGFNEATIMVTQAINATPLWQLAWTRIKARWVSWTQGEE